MRANAAGWAGGPQVHLKIHTDYPPIPDSHLHFRRSLSVYMG